ncbi:MAG: hypothetical protein NW701_16505 [Nitrospira sp.]
MTDSAVGVTTSIAKVSMPRLSKVILVKVDKFLDSVQFRPRKTAAFLESDWIKPKFRDIAFALNMYMKWFITVTCIKEEAIGPYSQYSRHVTLSSCRLNISMLFRQDEA